MVLAVIPARLASTRFPRKVLTLIKGKPLLYHVWRGATKSRTIDRVIVASSDSEILKVAAAFGAETFKTSSKHKTGSDRSAEVSRKVNASVIVNVQADMIGLPSSALDRLVTFLQNHKSSLAATLTYSLPIAEAGNSDRVKVVVGSDNRALWFSRSPIPYPHSIKPDSYVGHVGVYAYRRAALLKFGSSPQTKTEKTESLEQLRFLERVGPMHAVRLDRPPRSIDRPRDLAKRTD